MSTSNVRASRSAADSIGYALHGRGNTETERAAELSCSTGSPAEFVRRAEHLAKAHGRTNELYSYTQNFSPDEFDVNDPADVRRVHSLGKKLAERMNTADFLVATHTDSKGGHLHNHIYMVNHDNITGKALKRCTSWKNGLRQVNDQLMRDENCEVLPSPEQPRPDWDLRREEYAPGGFERVLGDRVAEALMDDRSVDRETFAEVLAEGGVTLTETKRDGWTYRMRRSDNGKIGRRKASSLTPEFTSEGAHEIFEINAKQKEFHHGNRGHEEEGARRVEHEQHAADEQRHAGSGLDLALALARLAHHRRAVDERGAGAADRGGDDTGRGRGDRAAAQEQRQLSGPGRRGAARAAARGLEAPRGRGRDRQLEK